MVYFLLDKNRSNCLNAKSEGVLLGEDAYLFEPVAEKSAERTRLEKATRPYK
jgi:hypothetical protein